MPLAFEFGHSLVTESTMTLDNCITHELQVGACLKKYSQGPVIAAAAEGNSHVQSLCKDAAGPDYAT